MDILDLLKLISGTKSTGLPSGGFGQYRNPYSMNTGFGTMQGMNFSGGNVDPGDETFTNGGTYPTGQSTSGNEIWEWIKKYSGGALGVAGDVAGLANKIVGSPIGQGVLGGLATYPINQAQQRYLDMNSAILGNKLKTQAAFQPANEEAAKLAIKILQGQGPRKDYLDFLGNDMRNRFAFPGGVF